MVVMREARGKTDTTALCKALGITREYFIERMEKIKRSPGYSSFTQQLFMNQLSDKDFSLFQEKIYRFPGFYIQRRSIRQYQYPYAAHVLGDMAEVSPADIEDDDYYQPGDYIGKLGVERSYEKQLRGEKGVQILLRDAHGRVQGSYQNGALDRRPVPGKEPHVEYRPQSAGTRRAAARRQDRQYRGYRTVNGRGAVYGVVAHIRPAYHGWT